MYEETITRMRKIVQDYKGRLTPYMRFTIAEAANAIEEQSVIIESYRNRMRAGCDWIPVTERLPKESGEYLVYICIDDTEPFYGIVPFDADVPAFGRWEEHYDPVTYGLAGSDFVEIRDVTHWMPLPEPPKEEA